MGTDIQLLLKKVPLKLQELKRDTCSHFKILIGFETLIHSSYSELSLFR